MSETKEIKETNAPKTISGKKFSIAVIVFVLWLAYVATLGVLRRMGY
jgi:hypothetical protein